MSSNGAQALSNDDNLKRIEGPGESTPLLSEMHVPNTGERESTDPLVNPGKPKKWPQYVAAISATLGAFALGTSLAWTSPVSSADQSYLDKIMRGMSENKITEAWSWIGALMPLGAAAVSLVIGYIIGKLGPKITMLLLTIPFTVGWILIITSHGIEMIYAGRFILGMAGGAFAVAAPLYTSEIAEKEVRGALGSYFQLMVTLGILFAYIVGSQVSAFVFSIICGVIPLIFCVSFSFMPESPEFLLSRNKHSEAVNSLKFLRGKNYNIDQELRQKQENIDKIKAENLSFIKSLNSKAVRKSLCISLGLMFIQQLSGVNAVIFYTSDIFEAASEEPDPDTKYISSIIVGSVQVVSTFASTLIVDRLGRKILLLVSGSVMCICTMVLGIFFYLKEEDKDISSITWLPLLSLCVFMVAFSIGFGPIPWMITGEIFLPAIKETASSIACCFNWILAFFVTKFYAPISQKEGTGVTFFIFMSILACGTLFVVFFVKETKGKSAEEIQKELED